MFEVIEWMKNNLKETNKYSKHFRNITVLESILKRFGRMNVEE